MKHGEKMQVILMDRNTGDYMHGTKKYTKYDPRKKVSVMVFMYIIKESAAKYIGILVKIGNLNGKSINMIVVFGHQSQTVNHIWIMMSRRKLVGEDQL